MTNKLSQIGSTKMPVVLNDHVWNNFHPAVISETSLNLRWRIRFQIKPLTRILYEH
jgi:hypothetical protein